MQTVLNILKWIGILLIVLLLVGFILPKTTHVERSIVINAHPMDAFSMVNNLQSWEKWDPWHEMEPTAIRTYSTPPSGNGAWYTWEGEKTGSGKLTVEKIKATTRIDTKISFEGQGDAEADFVFEKLADRQVKVTWMFDTEHGINPINRWFGLMMDSLLGGDYEKGLVNLKREAELLGSQSKAL